MARHDLLVWLDDRRSEIDDDSTEHHLLNEMEEIIKNYLDAQFDQSLQEQHESEYHELINRASE